MRVSLIVAVGSGGVIGNHGALPWQRVVGAGGHIRLHGEAAYEQRVRLEMEGVAFRGKRSASSNRGS